MTSSGSGTNSWPRSKDRPQSAHLGSRTIFRLRTIRSSKQYKEAGRIPGIDLLVPNIEFRIAPPNDNARAVNIHLLVCPDDPNHEAEILNALGRLSWQYGGRNYSCLPDQLVAFGRAFDPAAVDDRAALRAGVTQFKVDFTRPAGLVSFRPLVMRKLLGCCRSGR